MKKLYTFSLFIFLTTCESLLQAQSINLHSIANSRMPFGDAGYTLDGIQMINTSTAKLLDENNFGPAGTYPKTINITHAYENSGDLESISSAGQIDLFFFGTFDKNNFSILEFTSEEIDSLYNWSLNGGKVIIGGAANSNLPFDFEILNSKWEYEIGFFNPSLLQPTAAGATSSIFDGPFGIAETVFQGGSVQGYFSEVTENSIILAQDNSSGDPTLILDCKTLDLILADGDAVNSLGGVTSGAGVSNDNDKFWVNLITYMDELQSQPILSFDNNTLSTGTYSSYQWFKDGNPISGATSSSFNTNGEPGSYTVEVSLDCGCNNVSSNAFLIAGINEFSTNTSNLTIFPNPSSKNSVVSFLLKENEQLRVSVTDLNGREISVLFEGKLSAGEHQINLLNDSSQKLDNGLYLLNLRGDKTSTNRRFIVRE